jgi:hypothetical protein
MVRAIEDSPSLNNYPAEQLAASYQRARCQAAQQTNIELSLFPNTCPYVIELVLVEDW